MSTDTIQTPIPLSLLEELVERFPKEMPKLDWNDRRVWLESGKQEIIDFLIMQYQAQQKDSQ